MTYLLSLLLGFVAASIGVIPPGLLNMTALRIRVSEGQLAARLFIIGAVAVVGFESFLALWFSRYLDQHPEVVLALRETGCAIFFLLSLYFFYLAKFPKPAKETMISDKKSWLLLGMIFSALNFLNIPFYVAISLAFASYEIFSFTIPMIICFVIGVFIGSWTGFYSFISFFRKNPNFTNRAMQHMNLIIALVLFLVSMLTLVHILKYYLA